MHVRRMQYLLIVILLDCFLHFDLMFMYMQDDLNPPGASIEIVTQTLAIIIAACVTHTIVCD